jgi:hypothetical protein
MRAYGRWPSERGAKSTTSSWRAFGQPFASEGGGNEPVAVVGAGAELRFPERMPEHVLEAALRKTRS